MAPAVLDKICTLDRQSVDRAQASARSAVTGETRVARRAGT